jgi:EmrB/QacA subfamily drug resistance transporter
MGPARRKRLTLVACILGSAVVFLDSTVVNVALPALRRDLDTGLAAQQWVVEAYLLTLGSLLLIGGSLGDIYGRRRVFVLGLVAFGATSLLCAAAPSAGVLVAGRALQGVAGALLVPSSLAIITASFGDDERGGAIGLWTAWTGISIVIGPLVGGALVDAVSWRLVFALNLPLVAGTLALVARAVPESRDPTRDRAVDVVGGLLCALGLGGIVFALTEEPMRGFGDPAVAVPLVAGVACAAAFVPWERRSRHPMLPLELFRSRNFAISNLATVAVYGGLVGSTFLISIFVQQVAGYSAFEAGLALMPVTLILFLLSRRLGALADRLGPRAFMGAGPLVAGAGLLMLVRLDRDVDYAATLLPALVVFGVGLSLTVAPLTTTVLGAVEQRFAGVASGVNNAVARIAGLVAIAVVGAAVSAQFGAALDERLASRQLDPSQREAVARVKDRPLSESTGRPELRPLEPAIDDASVEGFRVGIAVAAGLVISGGLISIAGIRNPGRVGAAQPAVRPST